MHGAESATSWPRRLATHLCLALLVLVLVRWFGENLQSLAASAGERIWPGYNTELRVEPEPPGPPPPPPVFGPPPPRPDMPAYEALDLDAQVDAFTYWEQAERGENPQENALRSHAQALAEHEARARAYESIRARRDGVLRAYAAAESSLAAAVAWMSEHLRHAFLLLIAIGGWVATGARQHISMRAIRGPLGDRLAHAVTLGAALFLVAAVVAQARSTVAAGTGALEVGITGLWLASFVGIALLSLVHLVRPRVAAPGIATGGPLRALLCAPLFAVMALLAGAYFLVVDDYPEGLAVYLEMLLGNAQLYLNVALYIWAGMLLKRTTLARRCFEILRPLGLSPELLTIVVVAASAIPTAYSGASGIFVIAAGALIYRELRAAGARPSLALASTAMSGSLGVVLSPCLLVVIVAYLCNDVGSEELFAWGRWVYLLTAGLFAIVVLCTRQGPLRATAKEDALKQSGKALIALFPHLASLAALLLLFKLVLAVDLDQESAPFILPLWLLVVLWLERRGGEPQVAAPVRAATAETTVHVGALLLLMALSAGLGGVIERSGVIASLPLAFASPWQAMAVLAAALVVIGMIMDPYGAVILVNATLYAVAKTNGIDPIHFWMVVLVAFELGYLTPPVALNHLLTRQVVGEEEDADAVDVDAPKTGSLWRRHERVLLPITVMAIALVLVAFAPLALGGG